MKENWYAFFISIVKGLSVEASFQSMYYIAPQYRKKSEKKERKRYQQFSNEDIEKMIELKKNLTYKQVAEIFHTVDRNVYDHIKRYKPNLIKSGQLDYKKSKSVNEIFQNGFSA